MKFNTIRTVLGGSPLYRRKYILLTILIIVAIALMMWITTVWMIGRRTSTLEAFGKEDVRNIPIVIICWNNYYFVKNMVSQLKKYSHPIIILDNKSNYSKLLDYYKELEDDDQIEVRLLDQNYGHKVYQQLQSTLPDVYILSDPDLELNANMPQDFCRVLLAVSNKYESYKVGLALDISDNNKFIECDDYTNGKNIYEWESQFWKRKITDSSVDHELYYADVDTTFCLINNKHLSKGGDNNIRIAGDFTAKHLPWYKDYIKTRVSAEEIEHWKSNNKSSSILFTCLKL